MPDQIMTVSADLDRMAIGYVVNASFSAKGQTHIARLQDTIVQKFSDILWAAPKKTLHITLLDLLTPVIEYKSDKDALFKAMKAEYTGVLTDILKHQPPVLVNFNRLEIHPSAIIIKGFDDGSLQRIRNLFLQNITLLPGTKMPPTIVHSTICKFKKPVNVDEIQAALDDTTIRFFEEIDTFNLVRESQVFMQQYEAIATFKLK